MSFSTDPSCKVCPSDSACGVDADTLYCFYKRPVSAFKTSIFWTLLPYVVVAISCIAFTCLMYSLYKKKVFGSAWTWLTGAVSRKIGKGRVLVGDIESGSGKKKKQSDGNKGVNVKEDQRQLVNDNEDLLIDIQNGQSNALHELEDTTTTTVTDEKIGNEVGSKHKDEIEKEQWVVDKEKNVMDNDAKQRKKEELGALIARIQKEMNEL